MKPLNEEQIKLFRQINAVGRVWSLITSIIFGYVIGKLLCVLGYFGWKYLFEGHVSYDQMIYALRTIFWGTIISFLFFYFWIWINWKKRYEINNLNNISS